MDLYSRMVVGWVLWRRKIPRGVILHSDRGSQYCSHDYQKLLVEHALICSMSIARRLL